MTIPRTPRVTPRRKRSNDQDWRDQAACLYKPLNIFYPEHDGPGAAPDSIYDAARAICIRCPVRQQCLDHAFAHDERDGVWGGLAPKERGRLRRTAS